MQGRSKMRETRARTAGIDICEWAPSFPMFVAFLKDLQSKVWLAAIDEIPLVSPPFPQDEFTAMLCFSLS